MAGMLQQARATEAPDEEIEEDPTGEAPEAESAEDVAADSEIPTEPATPQEQEEYERAVGALYTTLYKNDKASAGVVGMLQAQSKIDSTVKTALLLITQIDQKLSLDQVVLPQLLQDAVSNLMEIGEAAHGMRFSEQEQQVVLATAYEGLLNIMGFEPQDAQAFLESLSPEERQRNVDLYSRTLESVPAQEPGAGGAGAAMPAPAGPATGAPGAPPPPAAGGAV